VRVVYFSQDYSAHDYRFLNALGETEHEVLYLRLERRRNLESRPLPPRVHGVDWWGGKGGFTWSDWPRMLLGLRKVIRQLKPDLIHAGPIQHCAFPVSALGFKPLVSMSWGSDLLAGGRTGLGRATARFALERSAALIADCQAVRQAALAMGMRSDRIVVFPWGVDLEKFRPARGSRLRAELGWDKAFVLISTRAWEPVYGIDVLVEGFCQAAMADPRLRLLMLGGGRMAGLVQEKLAQAGMSDRVHLAGQIEHDRLPEFYRASDLYLSASHSDGSSVSLLEAMACGLPALVSDILGNREWVEPGVNGWWFPDGDPAGLAAGIARAVVLDNLEALGKAGRKIVEVRADWTRNVGLVGEAYRLALADGPGGMT